jgi:hypothetical protein
VRLCGAVLDIDESTGRARAIHRIENRNSKIENR